MNKGELCLAIANRIGTSQANVEEVIDAFSEIVSDRLADGEKVQIYRFGTFDIRDSNGRIMYNPSTNQKQTVSPKRNVVFRPGKDLRMSVNEL
ncbi:MAG: HU family DNA-binding protein [Clostridia bacterium]|nr:HU family DNA-binding protein [Clostridia bacterium]